MLSKSCTYLLDHDTPKGHSYLQVEHVYGFHLLSISESVLCENMIASSPVKLRVQFQLPRRLRVSGIRLLVVELLSYLVIIGGSYRMANVSALVLTIFFPNCITLFHVSLNAANDPLLASLPQSLKAEERSFFTAQNTNDNGSVTGRK